MTGTIKMPNLTAFFAVHDNTPYHGLKIRKIVRNEALSLLAATLHSYDAAIFAAICRLPHVGCGETTG